MKKYFRISLQQLLPKGTFSESFHPLTEYIYLSLRSQSQKEEYPIQFAMTVLQWKVNERRNWEEWKVKRFSNEKKKWFLNKSSSLQKLVRRYLKCLFVLNIISSWGEYLGYSNQILWLIKKCKEVKGTRLWPDDKEKSPECCLNAQKPRLSFRHLFSLSFVKVKWLCTNIVINEQISYWVFPYLSNFLLNFSVWVCYLQYSEFT